MRDRAQQFVLALRQRLLDERHPELGRGQQMILDDILAPALVGIEDDPAARRRLGDSADARVVVAGADLDLQQRPMRIRLRTLRHRFRLAQRNRIRRDELARRDAADKVLCPDAASLAFKVPQGAVDGIARRPGFHFVNQFQPSDAAGHERSRCLDRFTDVFHSFAVARVRHTFAASAMIAVGDDAGQHGGFSL